jgi:hypothetical protein
MTELRLLSLLILSLNPRFYTLAFG